MLSRSFPNDPRTNKDVNFEVVEAGYARQLREKFIERFVDTECEYFQRHLPQANEYVRGFLWDCLKAGSKKQVTQERAAEFIKDRGGVYFMWDHWREGTVFADEYPNTVIKADGGEVGRLSVEEWNAEIEAEKHDCYIEHPQLPSDIYVFDDSFSWYAVFTHEFDDCESLDDIVRYCIVFSE
ncbi:MAG: hypothetical protein K2J80_10215 [Oscillospiraceae bacterium]|nr:hypothetical protein [Oscillospiraceae bacterium]